jgi:hypothetical protein
MYGSYLNTLDILSEGNTTLRSLANYAWTQPGCSANEAALYAETNATLERVREKARRSDPTNSLDNIGDFRGRLETIDVPEIQKFIARHWWPEILEKLWTLRMHEAIWDDWNNQTYPSREEALYILARYQNHTRSLTSDQQVLLFQLRVESKQAWEGSTSAAKQVRAIESLKPTMDFVTCP